MEVFVRVAETGSFSRAAELLDLSNPMVTMCVRKLEQSLKVSLINRDTRRLCLTEEGVLYLARARAVLQAVEEADDEVRAQVGEVQGWLHVEVPVSLGRILIRRTLPTFSQQYPEISVGINFTNQPRHLIETATDLAIRMNRVEDADLIARPLCECRYVVCCSTQTAKTLPPHPGDLDPRRSIGILSEQRRNPTVWALSRNHETVEIIPAGPFHFNSSDAALLAAESSNGVTCVLDIFAEARIAEGSLEQVYSDWTSEPLMIYLVTPKARAKSARVRALSDCIAQSFASARQPLNPSTVAVRVISKR